MEEQDYIELNTLLAKLNVKHLIKVRKGGKNGRRLLFNE